MFRKLPSRASNPKELRGARLNNKIPIKSDKNQTQEVQENLVTKKKVAIRAERG